MEYDKNTEIVLNNYVDGIVDSIIDNTYNDKTYIKEIEDYVIQNYFRESIGDAFYESPEFKSIREEKDLCKAVNEFLSMENNNEQKEILVNSLKDHIKDSLYDAEIEDLVQNNQEIIKIELATEKIVDAIVNNQLNEKENEYLSKEFRYNFPQKEKYGRPTTLSLDNYSRETLENGIKEGLEKDPDFLLDMQHSGKIVPVPSTYYTNDIDYGQYVEGTFHDILDGYAPSELNVLQGEDSQIFYHKLLGNKLYNSDKAFALRMEEDDFDLATKEFLKLVDNEKPEIKEKLLADFKEKIEKEIQGDYTLQQELIDNNYEDAIESFKSEGFLNEPEAYLILATDINWKRDSGSKLKRVENFGDIIKAITPDADYTIDLTRKPNTPYFEARVSSHDVPTGSHVYILPESQWDKLIGYDKGSNSYGKGYEFINEAIEKNDLVKEIFHSRKMEREMEKEAKNNPVVKKMLEVYKNEIYDRTGGDTFELHNGYAKEDSWYNVGEFLADKIIGNKLTFSPKDFRECEKLLIKFNPTLASPEEISSDFRKVCQMNIEHNEYVEKLKNKHQR